jgi:DNA-binding CsgD family transcriptional regulator
MGCTLRLTPVRSGSHDVELIGREDYLSSLGTVMRRADLVGAFVVGPSGIGKSAVLTAASERASREGFEVLRIFGSHATGELPLWAFTGLVPTDAPNPPGDVWTSIRAALLDRAGGRPLLIAVDDAHLLDDTSAVLLGQLARERSAFLLCAARSGEPVAEPVSSLWREGLAVELALQPLAATDVDRMTQAVLGNPVEPGLQREFRDRAMGNPLYVRELALGSAADGAVELVDGTWVRTRSVTASPALVELIRGRIQTLPEDTLHALEYVALGEPVPVSVVESLVGHDPLIRLEEAGMLELFNDERRLTARLSHPVYGDVIRADMAHLRARRARHALADAVTRMGARRRTDTLAIASWRLDAAPPDAELFLRASNDARRSHDLELAERFARLAHDHSPDGRTTRALAMALHLGGHHSESVAVLQAALQSSAIDETERPGLELMLGTILTRGLGDYERADQHLAKALGSHGDGILATKAGAARAGIELLRGRPREALEHAQALLESEPGSADSAAVAVGSLAAMGRPAAALEMADAFLDGHGDPPTRQLFGDFRNMALLEAGRICTHEADLVEQWEAALERRDRHVQARLAFCLGVLAMEQGRSRLARQWLGRSAAIAGLTGEPHGERWAVGAELLVAAQARDLDGADTLATRLESIPDDGAMLFGAYVERGRAWHLAVTASPEQARVRLMELAERLLEHHNVAHAMHVLSDVARLGDPGPAAERMGSIEAPVDGELLPLLRRFVSTLAASDGTELGRVSEELEAIGWGALAAEAASAAADAFARSGDQRGAAHWRRRAGGLAEQAEGLATPLLRWREADLLTPLTRREREVATLVAEGRTSKEVAEMCFLSVRTVENHLARIYNKLGVSSRAELAEAISDLVVQS